MGRGKTCVWANERVQVILQSANMNRIRSAKIRGCAYLLQPFLFRVSCCWHAQPRPDKLARAHSSERGICHGESWHIAPVSGTVPVSGMKSRNMEYRKWNQGTQGILRKQHYMVEKGQVISLCATEVSKTDIMFVATLRLAHVKLIQEELKLTRDLRNWSSGSVS